MSINRLFIITVLTTLLFLVSCSSKDTTASIENVPNSVLDVAVNTTVRKTGQFPESFVITYANSLADKTVEADSFHLTGEAGYWGSENIRPFEADFDDVSINGNTLTLVPKSFPEKYFYVKNFEVSCSTYPELGFSNSDITKTITPIADDFETFTSTKDTSFDYHIYDPGQDEMMPIVIVFHGYGDTNNLLTYRTAVEWADPDNQAVRPCFVLAPVIDDETYFSVSGRADVYSAIHEIIEEMITDGRVDPDRVYVMGNSFGGIATIEYAEKYPDSVAGALALCPALNYSGNAMMNLKEITDIPIWFAHAKNDNTIPSSTSENAVNALNKLGAREVLFTEYTDDEMNAAGADPSPDATYSYHHVELAVMEDDTYMEWLFEKSR